jgi:anthranilate phosphoribosyltransferase
MNKYKISIEHQLKDTLDTCGTGGDGKSTFNISSAAALVLSALDIPMVKHGNAAQSGKVGSADIYKILGIPTELAKNEAQSYLHKHNFVFIFAPLYHPALKYAGKVRREIKIPTLFNYLGPLANPANPDYQIIGISRREKLPVLAEALLFMKRNHVILYSSHDGYDEVSTNAPTDCFEVSHGKIRNFQIFPEKFFKPFELPVISNDDDAKKFFLQAISGEDDKMTFAVAISCALALMATGRELDLQNGFDLAVATIKSQKVMKKLETLKV